MPAATKTTGAAFELGGSERDGPATPQIGNVADEKAMLAIGANLTVDNVVFHDAIFRTEGTHMECLYAIGVPGFTLRNSTFRDCAVMDVVLHVRLLVVPAAPDVRQRHDREQRLRTS